MSAQPCDWIPLGATTLVNGQTGSAVSGVAPASGRVAAMVADPANPDTHLFVGTALGGVWETTDGGLTWSTLPGGDAQASLAIGALALSGTTLFIGTGEANRGGDSAAGLGLLAYDLTTRTLTQDFPAGLKGASISSIVVGPGPTLFVGSDLGLWERSGGAWAQRPVAGFNGRFVTDVALTIGGYLWVAVDGQGLFVRHPVTLVVDRVPETVARLPQANIGRVTLGPCAQHPSTMYVAFEVPATTGPPATAERIAIFRTDDAPIVAPANAAAAVPSSTWTATATVPTGVHQLHYNNVLGVHPRNADFVYFGSDALHRSSDGGKTWQGCDDLTSRSPGIHVDQHSLIVADTPVTVGSFAGIKVWAGNDGGVWRSTDGGSKWSHRNRGLSTMQYFSVLSHPNAHTVAVGGTQDNGLQVFFGEGAWKDVSGGDASYLAIDPVNPRIWYGSYIAFNPTSGPDRTFTGFNRSDEGGADGTFVTPPGAKQISVADDSLGFAPYIVVPTGGATPPDIWVGTERLYRTDDRGGSFTPITVSLRLPPVARRSDGISAIAVAPGHPERVYIGTSEGRFFVLDRPGANWPKGAGAAILTPTEPKTTGAPVTPVIEAAAAAAGLPKPSFITAIVAVRLPAVPEDRVYVTVGHNHVSGGAIATAGAGVFVSDHSGKSFTHVPLPPVAVPGVAGGIPSAENGANAVVIDPSNADVAWIGCDYGVFQRDAAANPAVVEWRRALPNAPVLWLDLLNSPSRLLRAATHGRGVWETLADAAPPGGCVNAETFLRDTIMDDARGPTPATATDPFTGKPVTPNKSIDIAFDVPSRRPADSPLSTEDYQPTGQLDQLGFITLAGGPTLHHKDAAKVYIRVHNRGPEAATQVAVAASWADADGTVPPLPNNFFAPFPGSAPPTGGGWTSLGAVVTIARIPPGESKVATFDFSMTDVPDKIRVLAATSSAEDPFGAAPGTDALQVAQASRHVAVRDIDVESSGHALLIAVLVILGAAVVGTAVYLGSRD